MTAVALFASCASSTKTSEGGSEVKDDNHKVLVAYFSATGITKAVAEMIAKDADANLFEIDPAEPYTEDDLDWRDSLSRSSVEMKNKETSRPAVKDTIADFSKYDLVFVGYPVWWYTCPTIINTFLESYDWKGKVIVPFATSGGSPVEPCVPDMEKSAPGAVFKDAKLLNAPTDSVVKAWVAEVLK